MTTRITLKQRIARILNRADEVVALLPVPLATTTIAADTTSLRDTALARGTTAAGRYDHRAVEIIELVASGPAIGEVAVVTNAGFDNIDKLTLSPAFSLAVRTGTDYILWPKGVAPEMINQHINDLLRATYHPYLWIPSIVDDADFESGLGNWADVGSPLPATALSTVAADVLLGDRSIHLQADAIGEGVESNVFRVTEKESLLVMCFVRADVDAVQVILRNETASSNMRDPITINEELYTEVRFTEAVPAGCEEARLQFLATATDTQFFLSPPVIVQSSAGRPHALPSWLVNPRRQIKGAIYLRQGFSGPVDESFIALSRMGTPAPIPDALRSDRSLTPGRVILQADTRGPIAFMCQRPFAELTSDTASTNADEDYVAYGVVARLLHDKKNGDYRTWQARAQEIAVARGYGERRLVVEENPKVLVR